MRVKIGLVNRSERLPKRVVIAPDGAFCGKGDADQTDSGKFRREIIKQTILHIILIIVPALYEVMKTSDWPAQQARDNPSYFNDIYRYGNRPLRCMSCPANEHLFPVEETKSKKVKPSSHTDIRKKRLETHASPRGRKM